MKIAKPLIILTFLLASTAFAVIPTRGKSFYGNPAFGSASEIDACLDASGGAASCTGAAITAQEFEASSDPTVAVFDFMVNNLDAYTLTLSSDAAFLDFGIVSTAKTSNGGDELVGPDPNSADSSSPACSVFPCAVAAPASVTFTVPTGGAGLVFYVLEQGSIIEPTTVCADIPSGCGSFLYPNPPGVQLTQLTSTVPEPGSWILLGSAFLMAAVLGRRRIGATAAVK